MPEAVLERVEAARLDHAGGELVHLAPLGARMDRVEALLLRVLRDLVGAREVVRQVAGRERARAVGAVAVDHRARVDDDQLVRLDAPVARMVVRDGAVRAAADDRVEGGGVGAGLAHRPLDEPHELLLGLADEPVVGERLVHVADDRRRAADRVELGRLLRRTDLRDDGGRGLELDPGGLERLVRRDVHVVGLEGDVEAAELAQARADPAEDVALGLEDLDSLQAARGREVAVVGREHRRVAREEHGGVRALEPGQVVDVRRRGDEERLDPEHVELGAELFAADLAHADSARWTSASRYPSGPLPITRKVTISSRTEKRRHSSRLLMSDRWTSTTGAANSSTASRIA